MTPLISMKSGLPIMASWAYWSISSSFQPLTRVRRKMVRSFRLERFSQERMKRDQASLNGGGGSKFLDHNFSCQNFESKK